MADQQTARRLYRVKPGRALVFPGVAPENNAHLWARGGEVVDATHPTLHAIVQRTPHNVVEIDEQALARLEEEAKDRPVVPGRKRMPVLSGRMHPSMKARMRQYDEREKSKPTREASRATAKAQRLGTDPKSLPKATREAS